jgi:hypothetical protein
VADPEQSILNKLSELFNTLVLDRVVAWHKGANGFHTASRGRARKPEPEPTNPDNGAVWSLLSLVASRDLNKSLGQAVGLVLCGTAQEGRGRRMKDIVEALQNAALASIDDEGACVYV